MENQNQTTAETPPPPPTPITTLEQLESVCREAANTTVIVRGKRYTVPLRLLTPTENEVLNRIVGEAVPPVVDQADEESGEVKKVHNIADPDYIVRAQALMRIARALALAWCCPLFTRAIEENKGKQFEALVPGKVMPERKQMILDANNRDSIADFVGAKLTSDVQARLYAVARHEEDEEDSRVGF